MHAHLSLSLSLSLSLLMLSMPVQGAVISTFDTDADGWLASEHDNTTGALVSTFSPVWEATGGNPGGNILVSDTGPNTAAHFDAPAKFLGDKLSSIGGTLFFDMASFPAPQPGHQPFLVQLYNESAQEALIFGSAFPGDSFSTYAVPLEDAPGWTWFDISGSGTSRDAVAADFNSVFANLTRLELQAEHFDGPDSVRLDNVRLVPEPTTSLLVMTGVLGLATWRRRPSHTSLATGRPTPIRPSGVK